MANALYPKTKKRFMAGDIDLTAVAVYAALINVSGQARPTPIRRRTLPSPTCPPARSSQRRLR